MSPSIFDMCNDEIYLVTTSYEGETAGMIATWITKASLPENPLRIVTVFSPENYTTTLIRKSKEMVLHLLSSEQLKYVPRFGLPSSKDLDKFEDIPFQYIGNRLPVLKNTCGWMKCKVIREIDCGDRFVFISHCEDHQLENPGATPLRKKDLQSLPDNILKSMSEKSQKDLIRDSELFKN